MYCASFGYYLSIHQNRWLCLSTESRQMIDEWYRIRI